MPSAFFSFFSILVLLGVLYWVANVAGLTRLPTEVGFGPTITPTVPVPTQWPTMTPQPSDAPASPLPPTSAEASAESSVAPTPTQEAPLVVEVRVAPDAPNGSWMTVTVDGRPNAFTGTLLAAASQRFPAQNQVSLHVGDASVVELIVNGISQGRMGTVRGGTMRRTIDVQNPTGSTP